MTRDELLATMRAERARWEALLDEVGDGQMALPGAEDAWSVCDVVAHIAAYEHWLADQLDGVLGGQAYERLDRFIALNLSRRASARWRPGHGRSPHAIRVEAAGTFARLLELVAALPEEALGARGYGWTARRPLWRAIAGDSYEHYAEHSASICVWLAGRAA
jgi:hypothetical protein